MLQSLWAAFKAKFPPNRAIIAIMGVLTPLLAIAAGDLATWSTKHVAGLHLTQGGLTAAFIAGAATVVAAVVPLAYRWMTGWIAHEGRAHEIELAVIQAGHTLPVKAQDIADNREEVKP
jgi:hypothetical protein